MKKERSNSQAKESHLAVLVEIRSWQWDFSFGIGSTKWSIDPYSDYRHLDVEGDVRYPPSLEKLPAKFVFLPDVKLNRENRQSDTPRAIGSLSKERNLISGLCSIPEDVLASLLGMLSANLLKSVTTYGTGFRYRKSILRNIRLSTSLDSEGYLEAPEL
jgi:hypothetical protein